MTSDLVYISRNCTYGDIQKMLTQHTNLQAFPLVDSGKNMILLGSIQMEELGRILRNKRLEAIREQAAHPNQKQESEDNYLKSAIDFEECTIDPAPFQLVERTTLYKAHSLFSILGLNHSYVTSIGRLVGVVSLVDVSTNCLNFCV